MFLSWSLTLGLILALSPAAPPPPAQAPEDFGPLARRIAASAQLAAQEYGDGVVDGRVVLQAEVEEARLFLAEARRSAERLPPDVGRAIVAGLDRAARLVAATAPPDSVHAAVRGVTDLLVERLGVELDEVPALAPSLSRGAEIYQARCAGCHGTAGRGDGQQAAGLDPPAANLTDAAALADRSPLDFYRRVTLGVAGTAMPAFETQLSPDDRWAVAVYSTVLRLPAPADAREVPPALRAFATTARMSDADVRAALGGPVDAGAASRLAAVRTFQAAGPAGGGATTHVFETVRVHLDSVLRLAGQGQGEAASTRAFDAYMAFETVERSVRATQPALATRLEAAFATLRARAAGGATDAELRRIRGELAVDLERAERLLGERPSGAQLFVQSFILLVREGLEAILILGALMAVLVKTGRSERKRDLHIGVGAALGASLLTAILLETVFRLSPAGREVLEGLTMLAATLVLFYVSYWLLSKMEVAKWNRFVRGKVEGALAGGSGLALASVAFLAVYREGFETVLFYKALFLTGGPGSVAQPIVGGMVAGGLVLAAAYVAINRFGLRLPLKPFFGFTSAFLYYMAFVFAGQGIAELQGGGLISTTLVEWGPRVPALGVYPTVESLGVQLLLVLALVGGLVWTFWIEPRRLKVTSVLVPDPLPPGAEAPRAMREPAAALPPVDQDLLRSLDRMDADLAELRAEIERIRRRLTEGSRRG